MVGKLISHYRIMEEIGRGGMGEVYLAEDTKLERQVALKFLPQDVSHDTESRQRFEREAKAAAGLNHANIVTIHEIGEHEGQVFIAMEYAKGRTLKELIQDAARRGEPLPLGLVVRIASQVAAGLKAAHAQGIVHRDIKPQNIVVGDDHGVKILDFGLAKLTGFSTLTKGSMVLGTMHYISPEQARGREADERSDLWALGVVLYEMLSGRLPFAGDSPQAILYSVIKSVPFPLDEHRPGLPARLQACVKRLLAKDPDQRYQDTGEFIADLEELGPIPEEEGTEVLHPARQGAPTLLGRLAGLLGLRRGRSRLRRRFIAGSLLALFLLSLLCFLSPSARGLLQRVLGISGIPAARHLAVLPIASGSGAEERLLADGFTAVITEKLTWLEKYYDRLWTVPASEILADRDKSSLALQRLWGCNLFIAGELYAEKDSLRLQLRLENARTGRVLQRVELQGHLGNLSIFQDGLLAKLLKLLDLKDAPGIAPEINHGGTSMPGAYAFFLRGKGLTQDNTKADGLDNGIALLGKALQQDPTYIQARLTLADSLRLKYRRERDPGVILRAMEQSPLPANETSRWMPALLVRAMVLKENELTMEAIAAFQEVLRLNARCYQACIELANAYTAANMINEAESLLKRAIALRPAYPNALAHLAYFYHQHGRFDEAIALYKEQAVLAPEDNRPLNNLGILYQQKDEMEKARVMFEKSNAIEPNITAQANLATFYFYAGEYRKALPLFQAVASKENDCIWWGNLADTYRQLPEFQDKARAAYQKAIAIAEKKLAKNTNRHDLLVALSVYYAHTGDKVKALDAIARACYLAPSDLEATRQAILVYEAVGERVRALEALEQFRDRLGSMKEIEKEPDLAALRKDPRYQRISLNDSQ